MLDGKSIAALAILTGIAVVWVDSARSTEPEILPAPAQYVVVPHPVPAAAPAPPPTAYPTVAPAAHLASPKKVTQFRIDARIVEDTSGGFKEFKALRTGGLMIADSDPTLAAINILTKHQLCLTLASPRLMLVSGHVGTLQVGTDDPIDGFQGIKLEVMGRELDDSTIVLELRPRITDREEKLEVDMAVAMKEGKTAVLRLRPSMLSLGEEPVDADAPPVYLAVTPTVVR